MPAAVAPPSGLAAWWAGDGSAADLVGANPGTLLNGAAFATGEVGQAFSLDGNNDLVDVDGTSSVAGPRTIEAWVRPNANTGYGLPILTGGTSGQGDFFGIAGTTGSAAVGQYELYVDHWNTAAYDSNLAVTPGAWNHVAMTYDGSTVRFYVNGVGGSAVAGRLYDYGIGTYDIGGNRIGGTTTKASMNGLLDEVTIYNRALEASEIQSIYSAGADGKNKFFARSVSPADGQTVANPPTDFVIDLSRAYSTVQVGGFTVNGVAADSFTPTDADTLTFHFLSSPVTTQGWQTIHFAAGVVQASGTGELISESTGTFRYSTQAAGWLTTYSVVGNDPLMDLAQDTAGNTYATGWFAGTMTIGSTTLVSDSGGYDGYAVKLDPQGEVLWAQRFGGTGQDRGWGIDVGDDGSVYVTGDFSGTMTAGANALTSAGGADVFVLALDTDGTVLWARRCGTATGNDKEAHIAVADDGSVYVTGVFNSESQVAGTANFGTLTLTTDDAGRDNFLAKLNSAGDFLWARQLDWGATPWDILTEAGGDVFTVGGALARYDSSGNLLWSQERVENVGALYQDPTTGKDYLYIAEFSNEGTDGSGVVRKLDADTGIEVWTKSVPAQGGHILAVDTDASGNIYLTGDGGSVDLDPGIGTYFLSDSGDVLRKLDAQGDFVSARRMVGYNAWGLEVDTAGNVFLGGDWGGTAEFDLGDTTAVRTSPYSQGQGFILKMTQGLGAISGRVFADADNNGTPGTDEPPLAGATVYLDQNGNGSPDAGEASVTTDAFGVYNFIHLPAGTYTVRHVLPVDWSPYVPAGGAHVVTLAADQFVGGRDFGDHWAPTTTTYTNNTSLRIGDHKTATSTIVVSGGTSFIYDVDVQLNITHTNDGDLRAYLIAPDGTRILLTNHHGGSGDHYTNTIFDDEAAASITTGAAPFTGRYRPEWALTALDGKNANGTWTLEVTDAARKNTGTLLSWSLTVTGASTGSGLRAAQAASETASAGNAAADLTVEQLQPLLAEAAARWSAAGVDVSNLANVTVQIVDLADGFLGLASGNTIWLDDNAAGWGWFVDATPGDDSEFTTPGDQGEQGRMDLLTVIMHELGHLLGLEHTDDGVMHETLAAGTRAGVSEQPTAVIDDVFSAGPPPSPYAPLFWGDVLALLEKDRP